MWKIYELRRSAHNKKVQSCDIPNSCAQKRTEKKVMIKS